MIIDMKVLNIFGDTTFFTILCLHYASGVGRCTMLSCYLLLPGYTMGVGLINLHHREIWESLLETTGFLSRTPPNYSICALINPRSNRKQDKTPDWYVYGQQPEDNPYQCHLSKYTDNSGTFCVPLCLICQ